MKDEFKLFFVCVKCRTNFFFFKYVYFIICITFKNNKLSNIFNLKFFFCFFFYDFVFECYNVILFNVYILCTKDNITFLQFWFVLYLIHLQCNITFLKYFSTQE